MTWFGWVFVALTFLSALITISGVGKKRAPVTPSQAVGIVIGNTVVILGVLLVGTGSLR